MMQIIFGFSKITNFNLLSRIIMLVSKRPFSHSYVRLEDPTSKSSIVFQASGLVVNLIEYSNFCLKETVIEEYAQEVTQDQLHEAIKYMFQQSGTNYAVLQLFLDLFYIIFKIKLPFRSTGEVCSEQSARMARLIGLKVPGDLSYYTPSDFQEFCAANMRKII